VAAATLYNLLMMDANCVRIM